MELVIFVNSSSQEMRGGYPFPHPGALPNLLELPGTCLLNVLETELMHCGYGRIFADSFAATRLIFYLWRKCGFCTREKGLNLQHFRATFPGSSFHYEWKKLRNIETSN